MLGLQYGHYVDHAPRVAMGWAQNPSLAPAGQPQPHLQRSASRWRPLQPRACAGVSSECRSFTELYAQLAGVLVAPGSTVVAAPTLLGRGLVAMQRVAQGSTLLSVDWANMLCVTDQPKQGNTFGQRVLEDWQLLHGRLPPLLVQYLLADEGDWFVRLVAYLLWLKRNAQGPWRLYINLLPKEEEMTMLMNYRPEELGEFQSALYATRAALERSQIEGLHDRLFSSSGGELRALQVAGELDDTVWASSMVNSRCFSDTIDGETVSLIVPCADMANHVLVPNVGYRFDPAADAFQLTALQDIEAGVEACISYGCTHKSNEELMRDYGFVILGNLNDRVPFSTGDDIESQLAAQAAGGDGSLGMPSLSAPWLLAALGLNRGSSGSGGTSSGSFNLMTAAQAAMGDDEANVARRRQLATLMSLQPMLRDIPAADSPSSGPAAAAAAATAAPPPRLGEAELQWERQSAAVLLAQCQQLLSRMPTSADTDEALLAADAGGSGGEPIGVRRRQAVAARLETKRLLLSAQSVLQAYAASLG